MIFDEDNINYERESQNGLIPIGFYLFFNHIQIPLSSIKSFDTDKFKKDIDNIINNIEGVCYQFFPNSDIWILEYGTRPIEFTVDKSDFKLLRIIKQKKWCAIQASLKAIDKFPLLHDDNYDSNNFSYDDSHKWCKINIYLRYNKKINSIIIELNRTDGDHFSFYDIKNKLNEKIHEYIIQ
jgi:hypothetical protein